VKRIVDVMASSRREGMYLYVERGQDWCELPESLRQAFGAPRPAMTLVLTPERRLARVNAAEVIAAIDARAFYLQMPPAHPAVEAGRHDG